MSTKAQNARREEERQKIVDAGLTELMISAAKTGLLDRFDADGNRVGTDQLDPATRMAVASKLVQKVLPDLKAVEIDGDGGGVTFQILAPFDLPGSRVDQDQPDAIENLRDVTPLSVEPVAVEAELQPDPEPAERPRRRVRRAAQ